MFVEFAEGAVFHLDSSPNRRIGTEERDLELVNRVGWLRLPCGGLGWHAGDYFGLQSICQPLENEEQREPFQRLAFEQRLGHCHYDAGSVGHGECAGLGLEFPLQRG